MIFPFSEFGQSNECHNVSICGYVFFKRHNALPVYLTLLYTKVQILSTAFMDIFDIFSFICLYCHFLAFFKDE